jgi:GT2 family glycosyltransferase
MNMKNNNDNRINYKQDSIYIILVTYNGEKWIRECLRSLIDTINVNTKVIIIDNASSDMTKETISEEFNQITVKSLQLNQGYGVACNIGIEYAYKEGAEFVIVLNQDVILEPKWLEPLISASKKCSKIGVLSPFQIKYDSDEENISQKIIMKEQIFKLPDDIHLDPEIYPVRSVVGACLCFPRKTLEKVGGFDPGYFMYGEETDLCERIIYHGMFPVIVKNSIIRHYSARKDFDISSPMSKYYFRNQYLLFLKNPHESFSKNIYTYFRCVMADITKRLWKEFVEGKKGSKIVFLFLYRYFYSQIHIIISINSIYKAQNKCRKGPFYLNLESI